MNGLNDYVRMANDTHLLREKVIEDAIKILQFPPGSRGLDAGCGIGLPAMMLAAAIGPAGHVTGIDLSLQSLAYAQELVDQAGYYRRISFQEGDVRKIPFKNDYFDWAWSLDCVGYAPIDPQPLISELIRVVKPGGFLAILAWSSETLLPGYPLLEAKLDATSAGLAPFAAGMQPEIHFTRALGWYQEAGMVKCSAHTLASDVFAPMSEVQRRAMNDLIQMRWPGVETELKPEDRAEYQRLCMPQSPDFILDYPEYYAFFTYSMFTGKVAS